jgi:hypothetical protein
MLRYAILRHQTPPGGLRPAHWDFLLEGQGSLRTWALGREPDSQPAQAAEALPDHRLVYLDYEGPISGGRGHVLAWDRGTFRWIEQLPDRLVVEVDGVRLRGMVTLQRVDLPDDWEFRYLPAETPP